MEIFKAYDIRGIYNRDFNKNDVRKIGFFIPRLLNAKKVLVGRDVRISSDEIFENLVKGITDAGADVYDIGLATTPMVYYSTAHYGFDASVMITASHNPKEYNGLKISRKDALPVGYDTGLSEIEKWMETEIMVVSENKGKVIPFEIRTDYLNFMKKYLSDFSNLKMAVDCSNGMSSLLVKDLLGNSPVYIFEEPDGTFPNHEPNPLIPENTADLKKVVLKEHCDIGVIFDGDADRVMFVDEKGQFISPDLMIAVLGIYFSDKEKGKALQDIRTSKAVKEYIEKLGYQMYMWRVGRAYAALKLRQINGLFGGELAGHYYFRDFYYSDSGMLACLIMLNVFAEMKKQGKTVSELMAEIAGGYINSGEINFKIQQKAEAMEAIKDYFMGLEKATAFYDFDGYRVEFRDWWFNIRPSNTEPYLRFLAEALSRDLLDEKLAEVNRILAQFK